MRLLSLLVALCSVTGFAQPYELFVDRGDTFVRAGSAQGLELGATVTIWGDPIPTTTERRRAGTGVVMELWSSLARVNLDDAAKADKTPKKFASFEGKAKPTPPPAPPAAAPAPSAPPSPPPSPGVLKGRGRYKGAGPWMVLTVWNDDANDWTRCTFTLGPGNLVYSHPRLKAGDHETVALSNFVQQGPAREGDQEWVSVRCAEGASRFLFEK